MSTPTNDGGPAFPTTPRSTLDIPQDGMTLRDWFAGQALAGFFAQPDGEYACRWRHIETGERRQLATGSSPSGYGWVLENTAMEAMAESLYAHADAMLAERAKGGAR